MLLQLIAQHPQALAQVVKNTPVWVWGLLAGLTALTLAADDLLALAAAMAPDPWPYMAARAAVGALPTGADVSRPAPIPWPLTGQGAAAA